MKYVSLIVLLVLLSCRIESKRGGGRRGGTYRGSSNIWGRTKQNQGGAHPPYEERRSNKPQQETQSVVYKPQTPLAPSKEFKKSTGDSSAGFIQQEQKQLNAQPQPLGATNTQQRPIGWDTGNLPANPSNNQHQVLQPPYSYGNGYQPQYQHQSQYSPHQPQYVPYQSQYVPNQPQYYPHQQPQYIPHQPNYGAYGYGHMHPNYGGGGLFGGQHSPSFVGGYGQSYGGGFGSGFAKTAFKSAVAGFLVWHLVSGLTHRPYQVYNHYNNPEKVPEQISLPANILMLCPENVTSLCAPQTAPLCTTNNTIICVALAQETVPCSNDSALKCVNSTFVCDDQNDKTCKGPENKNITSTVNIPCITNATIVGRIENTVISGSLNASNDTTNLCVTTLALPQPEEQQNSNQTLVQNPQLIPISNVTNTTNQPFM